MEKKYTVTLRLSYQQYAWLGALCRRSKQTQSEETVGVCLSCQLVKIGTFANQLTDDVDMLLRDSFTYRTILDE